MCRAPYSLSLCAATLGSPACVASATCAYTVFHLLPVTLHAVCSDLLPTGGGALCNTDCGCEALAYNCGGTYSGKSLQFFITETSASG